ncbi:MAG: nucleotidyltransferase family protein [Actinomycetes bacterium]
MDPVEQMPLIVGVQLGSAALQVIADDHGVDLLQIKGPAVDPSLLATREVTDETGAIRVETVARQSVDADLLVRPAHLQRLFAAMRAHGWEMAYRFEDGSPFEHASTWLRPGLSSADVHRSFPGIGLHAEAAFDRLWADRRTMRIAGYPCVVPSLAGQRLILLLHAVRGGEVSGGDVHRAWERATEQERADVDALAADLRAEVALAACTGRLDQYRHAREHDLWQALATGNRSRLALWKARVKAQPDLWNAVRTAYWLVAPKAGRLERALGRPPTARELIGAWGDQAVVAGREVARVVGLVAGRVGRLVSRAERP